MKTCAICLHQSDDQGAGTCARCGEATWVDRQVDPPNSKQDVLDVLRRPQLKRGARSPS